MLKPWHFSEVLSLWPVRVLVLWSDASLHAGFAAECSPRASPLAAEIEITFFNIDWQEKYTVLINHLVMKQSCKMQKIWFNVLFSLMSPGSWLAWRCLAYGLLAFSPVAVPCLVPFRCTEKQDCDLQLDAHIEGWKSKFGPGLHQCFMQYLFNAKYIHKLLLKLHASPSPPPPPSRTEINFHDSLNISLFHTVEQVQQVKLSHPALGYTPFGEWAMVVWIIDSSSFPTKRTMNPEWIS